MRLSSALRAFALLAAAKGALVLLAGFGLLSLVHHDIQKLAERLIFHAHLNPAAGYPRIFIDLASHLTDTRILLLGAGGAAYALVRFIEAFGLWNARRWAEWFSALRSGVYVPFELIELYERFTWLSLGALTLNLAVVAFMLYCVFRVNCEKSVSFLGRGRILRMTP